MREALTCVVSVKVPEPKFSSQTKDKPRLSEVRGPVEEIVSSCSPTTCSRTRTTPRSSAARSSTPPCPRGRRRRARDDAAARACSTAWACPASSPTAGEGPGAVRDLHRRGRLGRRLGKQGRDRKKFQAILPLRGKILNVERARFETVDEQRILTLITALGTSIGKDMEFNPEKLRYHPHHPDDRRRRGWRAHPHPAADLLLPPDARAGGARAHSTSRSRRCTRSSSAGRTVPEGRRRARRVSAQGGK